MFLPEIHLFCSLPVSLSVFLGHPVQPQIRNLPKNQVPFSLLLSLSIYTRVCDAHTSTCVQELLILLYTQSVNTQTTPD